MLANPYTPGAGFMPTYLAGRDRLVNEAENYLKSIQNRYPQQSVVYYGLRGVGKTVLLNRIEQIADNMDILYAHIEANEYSRKDIDKSKMFTNKLVNAIHKFAYEISNKEKVKETAKKCLSLIKSFSITYNVTSGTIGFGIENNTSPISGNYVDDVTELIVELGKLALKSEETICIFVDEVQYLSEEEFGGLITAIHRCNQLRLPVMIFCAGLPKVLKAAGEAYSYAERLFKYESVDALNIRDAEDAIRKPAISLGIKYTDNAMDQIIEVTGGYPYFIQQFCSEIWKCADGKQLLNEKDVLSAKPNFLKILDDGFFAVRYNRCTNLERSFMVAMVKCEELPCTISNVAKKMQREVKSISPARGKLISKGMIYSTEHGKFDFTVPQFYSFIKRINMELEM